MDVEEMKMDVEKMLKSIVRERERKSSSVCVCASVFASVCASVCASVFESVHGEK